MRSAFLPQQRETGGAVLDTHTHPHTHSRVCVWQPDQRAEGAGWQPDQRAEGAGWQTGTCVTFGHSPVNKRAEGQDGALEARSEVMWQTRSEVM